VGRLLQRLKAAGVATLEQVVQRFDLDGDGRLTRAELEHSLATEAPNLSREERAQVASRFDLDGDGIVTTAELMQAFQAAEGSHGMALQRADETFARIHAAIARQPTPPPNVFNGLSKHKGYMVRADFEQLVRGFCPDLPHESVQLMWQIVDKNNDGGLTYEEFAQHFVYARKPLASAQSAVHMPDEYFCLVVGRMLSRLRAAGVTTVEQVRERGQA